jgi:dTDP-4-dehydrorhamnose reductase
MIVGANGTLGSAFARICEERGLAARALSKSELDITDRKSIGRVLAEIEPWAVVNAAGYVRVDDAEWDSVNCRRLNVNGAVNLGEACDAANIAYATFSTDLVFDGGSSRPYVEKDQVNPLGSYGASKVEAEQRLSAMSRQPLIVRTSAFFGPWDAHNFLTTTLEALSNGAIIDAADDTVVSPTYLPDLVNAVLDLLIDGEHGIWHLANSGETTWADLARRAAELAGLDADLVNGVPMARLNTNARRPPYSALGSERGSLMPSLEDALARYMSERPRSALIPQTASA